MHGGACTSQKGGFICLESAFHVWFLCSLQLRQHSWCSACFHVRGRSAGTVGGDDSGDELANVGGSINNTSLSISLPSYRALSETDRWQRNQVASYTATIDSGTYSDTKTAEAGGSLLFSAIPVGHYVITAYAKTANGDIMANTDPDNPPTVDVVAGQANSTTVQLNRLYYKTVSFCDDDGGPVAGIPEQRVTVGYTATKPEDPASPVAGKFFSHWVKVGGDSSAYNFNDPVTATSARWSLTLIIQAAQTRIHCMQWRAKRSRLRLILYGQAVPLQAGTQTQPLRHCLTLVHRSRKTKPHTQSGR